MARVFLSRALQSNVDEALLQVRRQKTRGQQVRIAGGHGSHVCDSGKPRRRYSVKGAVGANFVRRKYYRGYSRRV